ncbi:MAG TPA: MDR family MFS transporter [Candidatus Saccharimonadales bacterium]|nr:MDR family MFS transporter [Candidatus Saccharimonadales bacterium]
MLAVMSGFFLAALDQTIVSTALPTIIRQLNGLSELSWVITAYLLTSTVVLPISGKLSDMFGRKKFLLLGIAVFLIGSALSGTSNSMHQLIAFRAVQGIGAGLLMSNAFAVIGDLFTPIERGKWQGAIASMFGLASVAGPLLGGYLTDTHHLFGLTTDWRWIFYVNVPIGILALFLISTFMPHVTQKREKIDYLGATFITGGLVSLILALSWGGNQYAWRSWQILSMFALALVFFITFVFVERKAEAPLLPLSFFKNPVFRVAAPIVFLFGGAFFGGIIYIPLFKQEVQGATATGAGLALTPMVLSIVVVSIAAGQFISRTGRYKILASVGLAVTTVGLIMLSHLGVHTTAGHMALGMIITGAGLGVGLPVFNLVVQNAFPQSQLGVSSSSTQLARGLGGTVGVAALGSVLNNFLVHRLSNLHNNAFVQIAQKTGHGSQVAHLNENSVQGILSPQGQQAITSQLSHLPSQLHPAAMSAYAEFIDKLKVAFVYSIDKVLVVSAALVAVSFVISLFLREIPLRHHE